MVRIYTKTGDTGTTALFSGKRVPKDHPLIGAYGTVDELNSIIGVAHAQCTSEEVKAHLEDIQALLFQVGTDLATPQDSKANQIVKRVSQESAKEMEGWIDKFTTSLPPLKSFI